MSRDYSKHKAEAATDAIAYLAIAIDTVDRTERIVRQVGDRNHDVLAGDLQTIGGLLQNVRRFLQRDLDSKP